MELVLGLLVVGLLIGVIRQQGAISKLQSQFARLESQLATRLAEPAGAPPKPPAHMPWAPAPKATSPGPAAPAPTTNVDPAVAEPGAAVEPQQATPEAHQWTDEELAAMAEAATPEDQLPPQGPPETPAQPASPVPPLPPAPRFDWERFIGLRLPVWLGAIALCIAGFFFVSYAIESGFFTPEMRVLSAASAALAFLAGAEYVRRRVTTGNPAAIASALGAASIATAYATAYLATRVYDLFPSGVGLVATIGVSILAIAIALAYGQVVALVGIVGAYVAPIVYGGGEPSAPFLMIYVTAITAASYATIRYKSWWRLSVIGLLGPGFWGLIWSLTPPLLGDAYWSDAFLLALPLIVTVATWSGWREDGDIRTLSGLTGAPTPQRGTLIAAVILTSVGFVLFLMSARGDFLSVQNGLFGYWTGFSLGLWQGLIVFGALAVALGFASPPHRALQLPVLIATAIALLRLPADQPPAGYVIIGATAIIFGFGALDQFRRLREPALWAAVLATTALYLFALALFKIAGWDWALANKHLWALAALVLAGAFVALLRYYGPRIAGELPRSQVYAAWGGAVTTLVSLVVALELDPPYFPAAAAIGILGLAAVHLRVPVRGLRVLSVVYLGIYGLLLLGSFAYFGITPGYYRYVFAPALETHALILLVLPGAALLLAATLFQRSGAAAKGKLVETLDLVGVAVLAIGLYYILNQSRGLWPWSEMYVVGGRIVAAELLLSLLAVYFGRSLKRPTAYAAGLVLAAITGATILFAFLLPLLAFWPDFALPGTVVFNIALLAFALPAGLLFAIGWLARQDTRDPVRYLGIGLSLLAVLVTYSLIVVDIRQAWHLGQPTIEGDMSQSEYYAYSIATLLFGLGLLGIGVAFRHRGARAMSFVFVLAATIKVFLFDAAELGGLWRVLSFLLMGLSFLGISWAYARFVFGIGIKKPAPSAAEPPPASPPPAT